MQLRETDDRGPQPGPPKQPIALTIPANANNIGVNFLPQSAPAHYHQPSRHYFVLGAKNLSI